MKILLRAIALAFALLGSSSLWAQSTPVLQWDYESGSSTYLNNSYQSAAVQTVPVPFDDQGLTVSNVSDGTRVMRTRGWPGSVAWQMRWWRSGLNPISGQDVVYTRFRLGPTYSADLSNTVIQLRYRRTSRSRSPRYLRAFLTWENGGSYPVRYTSQLNLSSGTSWQNAWLSFNTGVSGFPSGGAAGNREYLLEIQAWGGSGSSSELRLDDVELLVNNLKVVDFGDWNGAGAGTPGFEANPLLRLGSLLDGESAAVTNATANGDDNDVLDDEDGVTWPPMAVGDSVTVPVEVHNNSGSGAWLQGWIDWDNSGSFEASEAIWTAWGPAVWLDSGTDLGWTQTSLPQVVVPSHAVTNTPLGARVRVTTLNESPPDPNRLDIYSLGEVEDYTVVVDAPQLDYGDYSGFATAGSYTDGRLRLGSTIDSEESPVTNSAADADDGDNADDEDGVQLGPVFAGQTDGMVVVTASNNTGADAHMNVWIDFNNDGDVDDPGEKIANNWTISNGANNWDYNITFTVPSDAAIGFVGVRTRLSSASNPPATGDTPLNVSGEVEDRLIEIVPTPTPGQCWHFRLRDLDQDGGFGGDGETEPAGIAFDDLYHTGYETLNQNWVKDPGEVDKGWFDEIDMSFDQVTQRLTMDVTVSKNRGDLDVLYFGVNHGPMATHSSQLAVVYIDGSDATRPEVTAFKYDHTKAAASYENRHMFLSTVSGLNAGDVKTVSVTKTNNYTRFRLELDCTRINDVTQWPDDWGINANSWGGMEFNQLVGLWMHANETMGAPVYDAGGYPTDFQFGDWWDDEVFVVTSLETIFYAEPCPVDYSDFGRLAVASSFVNDDLHIGDAVDAEDNPPLDDLATGDDLTGVADEDGVTLSRQITSGVSETMRVQVTNESGAPAYLSAWLDFDRDGVIQGDEQIATDLLIADGSVRVDRDIPFNVPEDAAVGLTAVRVRIATIPGVGASGNGGSGEVEDHAVVICDPSSTDIQGTVYYDQNIDGQQDGSENGISGVIVTVFDGDNNVIGSATTDGAGRYALNAVATQTLRLEFTSLPPGHVATPTGQSTHSVVQFVDTGSCIVDLGVYEPATWCATTSVRDVITSCFLNGDPLVAGSDGATDIALVSMRGTLTNGASKQGLATLGRIGAVWGIAARDSDPRVYTAAVVKNNSGLGPDGIGAIYRVDTHGFNNTALFYNFGGAAGSISSNPDRGLTGDSSKVAADPEGYALAGKAGLGGVELTQDGRRLYAVNLHDRHLYYVPVPVDGSTPPPGSAVRTADAPWITGNVCGTTSNVRRFWFGDFDRDVDAQGRQFLAASRYLRSPPSTSFVTNSIDNTNTGGITGTTEADVYRTYASGTEDLHLSFDVTNGTHTVVLHFSENYFNDDKKRRFDVELEGGIVLDNFDIYKEADDERYTAITRAFNVNITDGRVDLKLIADRDRWAISGVEIIPAAPATIPTGVFRPWAVKALPSGDVYVGGVCDGSALGRTDHLRGQVYHYDAGTDTWTPTPVLDFALDYVRQSYGWSRDRYGNWGPWHDHVLLSRTQGLDRIIQNAGIFNDGQPILSDLEFDDAGQMIIGLMDRGSLQWVDDPVSPGGQYGSVEFTANGQDYSSNGDILKASMNGGGWTIEHDGVVGSNVTSSLPDNGDPTYASGPAGPGGTEFYSGDNVSFYNHWETSLGGLAVRQGTGQVITTAYDPVNIAYTAGYRWLDNSDGRAVDGYMILQNEGQNLKGLALGDVEYICPIPDIELGNYVWEDADNNGRQDPDEAGIPNLEVRLYDVGGGSRILVATTQTDASGRYLFNAHVVNQGISPNWDYEIAVPLDQAVLFGMEPSPKGGALGSSATNDLHDSDADSNGDEAVIAVTTGSFGTNSHDLDIGLYAAPASKDFGDYASFSSASSTVFPGLHMGAGADVEYVSAGDDAATGDDLTDSDDEDGVTLPAVLTQGYASSMTVNVTNNSGVPAYLHAWVDFNRDGSLADSGEQIASNIVVPTGTTGVDRLLNFDVPLISSVGPVGVRVRLTSGMNPGPDGLDGNGEVEDHLTEISEGGVQTLPSGTYIIPMDNALQGNFNLKSYGLAVRLLHANVPLKWIINPAKGKDGIDFSASASRIAPTASTAQNLDFRAGPLAIHPGFESQALAVINGFGNNVAVYRLNAEVSVNVASTLVHKPKVAIFDQGGNGASIHVPIMQEAGLTMFTHYQLLNNAADIGAGSCFTVATEPHSDNVTPAAATALLDFLLSGGNFVGQCAAVRSYTQQGILSGYLTDGNLDGSMRFDGFHDPMAQFDGGLDDEGGSVTSFKLTSDPGTRIAYSSSDGERYKAYVGRIPGAPARGGWVHYLAGHEYDKSNIESINGRRMLLNGVLRSAGRPDTCGLAVLSDYGDWSGAAQASSYVTADQSLRLGDAVDAETSILPNATASRDDTTDVDDEDGVTMPATLTQDTSVLIPVSVFNNTGETRYLHAWIDFNNDGTFNDALVSAGGERLEPVRSVPSSGSAAVVSIPVQVPAAASVGVGRGARFRISNSATTLPTTTGGIGEVEDYVVQILNGPDYGDFSGFAAAAQTGSLHLRIGTNPTDGDAVGLANSSATGDDTTATDDEDLEMPVFEVGTPTPLTVPVTLSSPVTMARLNVFVDWNEDGDADDAGETQAVQAVTGSGDHSFTLTPPAGTAAGRKYLRLRLVEGATAPDFAGVSALQGEVEDYPITVLPSFNCVDPAAVPLGDGARWGFGGMGQTTPNLEPGISVAAPFSDAGVIAGASLRLQSSGGGFASNALTHYAPCLSSATITVPSFGGAGEAFRDTRSGVSDVWAGSPGFDDPAASAYASRLPNAGAEYAFDLDFTPNTEVTPEGIYWEAVAPGGNGSQSSYGTAAIFKEVRINGAVVAAQIEPFEVTTVPRGDGSYLTLAYYFVPWSGGMVNAGAATQVRLQHHTNVMVGDLALLGCCTCSYLQVDRDRLPATLTQQPYSIALNASGGQGPYTFSLSSGSLPSGLTLSPAGVLSGTPTVDGAYSFTMQVADSAGCLATLDYTLVVDCPPVSIETETLTVGVVGALYSDAVVARSLVGPQSLNGLRAQLPLTHDLLDYSGSRLDLDSGTGGNLGGEGLELSGSSWYESETSSVLDSDQHTISFYLRYTAPPDGNFRPLFNFSPGTDRSPGIWRQQNSHDLHWRYNPGNTGTDVPYPTTASQQWHHVVGVKDGSDFRVYIDGLLVDNATVADPKETGSAPLRFGGVDADIRDFRIYDRPLDVSEIGSTSTSGLTYSISAGTLPPGLSLNPANGAITGSPTAAGSYPVTVMASSGSSCRATRDYTLVVNCPVIEIADPSSLANAEIGSSYPGESLNASGGAGGYVYSQVGGSLPNGMSLASDGSLTGTPTEEGLFNITVRAVDATACFGQDAFTLRVCPVITLDDLDVPIVGIAYTDAATASGGNGAIVYSLASGTLPPGLTLDPDDGSLDGTPIVADTHTFTLRATDSNGCAKDREYTLTTVCPTLVINPDDPPLAVVGESYPVVLGIAGGTGPYSYGLSSGSLPPGLALQSDGSFSGSPSAVGLYSFAVTGTDSLNCTGGRSYTLRVCPVISLADLTGGTVGTSYSEAVVPTAGVAPFTFELVSGSLPAGLILDPATGVLAGTPIAAGVDNFTLRVTDVNGCVGERSYSVRTCPIISISPLPTDLTVGQWYNHRPTAAGGSDPYTFTLTDGALPEGLSLLSNGRVRGTPTTAETTSFTLTATDGNGCSGSQSYTLTVACPTMDLSPGSLTDAVVGSNYNVTLSPTGGGNAPYTFAVSSGVLPDGLSLDSDTGVISGTPTVAGSYPFDLTLTDAYGCSIARSYTLAANCPVITVTPNSVPSGLVGTVYSETIQASGGNTPYTFSISSGNAPAGLSINASSGVLGGTPTAVESATFTVTVTDVHGCTGSVELTLSTSCPPITIEPPSLPFGKVGEPYPQTTAFSASGATAPYSNWQATGLPDGLSVDGDQRLLTGTPTTAGSYTVNVSVEDAFGCPGTRGYSLYVCPVIGIADPAAVPQVGLSYSDSFVASNGISPYTFTHSGGTLPPGISLTSSGALVGIPTSPSSYTFTFTVTDGAGCSEEHEYTFTPNCSPMELVELPAGTIGTPYASATTATGGTAPHVYELIAGRPPGGLTFDTGSATLSGTPSVPTDFPPQAYWSFDNSADDLSGEGHHASLNGTTYSGDTPAALTSSHSLSMAGGSEYAQAPVDVSETAYTVSLWFRTTDPNAGLFSVGAGTRGSEGNDRHLRLTDGNLAARVWSNEEITSTGLNLADDAWHHVVHVFGGSVGGQRLYVDGVQVASGSKEFSNLAWQTMVHIGFSNDATTQFLPGSIDEVAIWNEALPEELILSLAAGVPANDLGQFTIRVTDAFGCIETRVYSLNIDCPILTVTPETIATLEVGESVSESLSTGGGTAPYLYNTTAGEPPPGLALQTDGSLSGIPTTAGTFTFTAQAVDAFGCLGSRDYNVKVCPSISLGDLIHGTVGAPYSASAVASGGTGPYIYVVESGTLPPGLALDTDTGEVSGVPTAAGTYSFTLGTTDATGCQKTKDFALNIVCAGIDLNEIVFEPGKVNELHTQPVAFAAEGGTAPYTQWQASGLPPGLSLNDATLKLEGLPTSAGLFTFNIRTRDANDCQGARNYSLRICPVIDFNAPPTNPQVFTPYTSSFSATDLGATYTFFRIDGTIPTGLTLATDGTLSGTPTVAGTFVFTVQATDSNGCSDERTVTMIVTCPDVTAGPSTLPNGNRDVAYPVQNFFGSGGTEPYTFTTIPAPLSGVKAWYRWEGDLRDSTRNFSLNNGSSSLPQFGAGKLGQGAVFDGNARLARTAENAQVLEATPATVTTWFRTSSHGTLLGGYASGGARHYPAIYIGTDGLLRSQLFYTGGNTFNQVVSPMAVNDNQWHHIAVVWNGVSQTVYLDGAEIGSSPLTFRSVQHLYWGESYTAYNPWPATNGDWFRYNGTLDETLIYNAALTAKEIFDEFNAVAAAAPGAQGRLPAGMSLSESGALTGTPLVDGLFQFPVTAVDGQSCAVQLEPTLFICPPLEIGPESVASALVGAPYSQQLDAYPDDGSHNWSITSGSLPSGLSLHPTTGRISGTPVSVDPTGATFTVQVSDGNGCVGQREYTLAVCPVQSLAPDMLPMAVVDQPYGPQQAMASGGTEPYSYAFLLPDHLWQWQQDLTAAIGGVDAEEQWVTPAFTDSLFGTALTPDGTQQGVRLPGSLLDSGAAWSIELWFSTTQQGVLLGAVSAEGGNYPAAYVGTDGRLRVQMQFDSNLIDPVVSSGSVANGDWQQLVVTWDGVAQQVFLNGNAIGTRTLPPSSISTLYVGTGYTAHADWPASNGGWFHFSGRMDDLAIYRRQLDSQQIGSLFDAGINSLVPTGARPPAGLTLDASGTFNGPVTGDPGLYLFPVVATDADGCRVTENIALQVCPVITVEPETLPHATVGSFYSEIFTADGGTGPYAFTRESGSLPAGISLAGDGTFDGIPTVPGLATFQVRARDANSCDGFRSYNLRICPIITVDVSGMPAGTQYASFNFTPGSDAGATPLTWTLSAGTLPTGLSLNTADGSISGTPTDAPGVYPIGLTVTDANGCSGSVATTLTINCPPVSITPPSVTGATQYTPYGDTTFTALGGTAPYRWTVSGAAASNLVAWWSADNTVADLTGAHRAELVGANFSDGQVGDAFELNGVSDYVQVGDTAALKMTLAMTLEAWVYPTGNNNGAILSRDGEYMLARLSDGSLRWAIANTSPGWTWVSSGQTLPLNTWSHVALTYAGGTATCYVNGIPVHTQPGSGAIGDVLPLENDFRIGGRQTSPYFFRGRIDEVRVYDRALMPAEVTASFEANQADFGLPAGLTLDPVSGVLSGTPTGAPGIYAFTVRAVDVNGCVGSHSYTMPVQCPVVTVTPGNLTDEEQFSTYSQVLNGTGGTAPYTWAVTSGSLPTGITLDPLTGELSGSFTRIETSSFTVQATDANGCTGSTPLSIRVTCPTLTISPGSLPDADNNVAFTPVNLSTDGGTAPYTYVITNGSLPLGLSLSEAGVISGTADDSPNTYVFEVRSTDAEGCSATRELQLTLTCPVITLTSPLTLGNGTETAAVSYSFETDGGAAPYNYSVVAGSLPDGIHLSNSGTLSGAPTTAGSYSFTVRSTDADGCFGTRDYNWQIDPASLAIGDLVWDDINDNGVADSGEPGLVGLAVDLFQPGLDGLVNTADDVLIASTTTDSAGQYQFTGLDVGGYFVKVTPLASHPTTSGAPSQLDNGVDGDNNGVQPGGPGTPVFSPIIDLAVGAEPITDGDANDSSDLTVDFGFWSGFTVGNLVWRDDDGDGQFDAGVESGIDGLLVQLLDGISGSVVQTTVTAGGGAYNFQVAIPGAYQVRINELPDGLDYASDAVSLIDDRVDNDNNGFQPLGPGTAAISPVFTLSPGQEGVAGNGNDEVTIDFGFTDRMSVGNLVFEDYNNNGHYDFGEALEGIPVHLFRETDDPLSDEPVAVAITDTKGSWRIDSITPGRYIATIPPAVFQPGGRLRGFLPAPSPGLGDDDSSHDSQPESDTATHGVRSSVVALVLDGAPTGAAESGFEGWTDDDIDSRCDMTIDLAVIADPAAFPASMRERGVIAGSGMGADAEGVDEASTFALWAEQNGGADPLADQDFDGLSQLAEYALGTDPQDATTSERELRVRYEDGSTIATVTRPGSGREDLRYQLQRRTGMDGEWTDVVDAPQALWANDGTLVWTWQDPVVAGDDETVSLRLRVELDADRNGTPEAVTHTPTVAAATTHFPAATLRSFAMPLPRIAVARGKVASVSGERLDLHGAESLALEDGSYYVEVLSGAQSGHRIELASDLSLRVDHPRSTLSNPGVLGGERVALRRHWTLRDLLPPSLFQAGSLEEQSDRVLFFEGGSGSYEVLWLQVSSDSEDGARWVDHEGILDLSDRVLDPSEAVVIHRRGGALSLPLNGVLPTTPIQKPTSTGMKLESSAVLETTPAPFEGLQSGLTSEQADRLRLWQGDSTAGGSGYHSYFLFQSAEGQPTWMAEDPAIAPAEPLLQPYHGQFLLRR